MHVSYLISAWDDSPGAMVKKLKVCSAIGIRKPTEVQELDLVNAKGCSIWIRILHGNLRA